MRGPAHSGQRADAASHIEDLVERTRKWGDQGQARGLRQQTPRSVPVSQNRAEGENNDDEEFNDEEISDSG